MLTRLLCQQGQLSRPVLFRVSTTLIKQLRELSGSPINDCKKALEQSNEDLTLAQQYLRERGLMQATKKLKNEAREGVIAMLTNSENDMAVIAQVNCETDFVARTQEFLTFSQLILQHCIKQGVEHHFDDQNQVQEYLQRPVNNDLFKTSTIEEYQRLLIAKLQENIVISKLQAIKAKPNSLFGVYRHNTFENYPCCMSACLLELQSKTPIQGAAKNVLKEGAENLATLYLGLKPQWIERKNIPSNILEEEIKNIEKNMKGNMNEKAKSNIVQGKLKKFYENNVFLDMDYILHEEDETITIEKYVRNLEKEIESAEESLSITRVVTLSVK